MLLPLYLYSLGVGDNMDIIKGCLDDISQAGSRSEKEMVSSRSLEFISSDVIGKKVNKTSFRTFSCQGPRDMRICSQLDPFRQLYRLQYFQVAHL